MLPQQWRDFLYLDDSTWGAATEAHCKPFHCKNCRFSLCSNSHCTFTVLFAVTECMQWITALADCRQVLHCMFYYFSTAIFTIFPLQFLLLFAAFSPFSIAISINFSLLFLIFACPMLARPSHHVGKTDYDLIASIECSKHKLRAMHL